MPVTNQGATAAVNFIKSIVFRFNVPHIIINDNGSNFASKDFYRYCEEMGIQVSYPRLKYVLTKFRVLKEHLSHYVLEFDVNIWDTVMLMKWCRDYIDTCI
jgi:DNA polymerase III alpha subunit